MQAVNLTTDQCAPTISTAGQRITPSNLQSLAHYPILGILYEYEPR